MNNSIRMLIMDVDGTLTDGKIYYASNGIEMKAFSIKDGYAIKHFLPQYHIIPVIITGRTSTIVERRASELGIIEVYQGISDKPRIMCSVMEKYNLKKENVAYIGDDLNDKECMDGCGYIGCPADAAEEIRKIADYVSEKTGGNGAVRDFIEFIANVKIP